MRADMAARSFWAFSQAPGIWAPGTAVGSVCVCLRSAWAQPGPGGEELVRKKAREEGREVERNCPPSHGNELPGLASKVAALPTQAGIRGHLSKAG